MMSQFRKRVSARQSSQGTASRSQHTESKDEDDDVSFTQPTSSQVQRGLEHLTPTQVDQKVAEVVQYILIKDQKKVPIKRADIVRQVIKEYKNIYPEIIKRVNRTFEQVFGLKLVEIDSKNHIYILIKNLEHVEGDPVGTGTGTPKTGLLFVILAVIFMRGGVVKESVIWSTLKKLRVDQGERHKDFGDVKKLITEEFVRQKYLEYARIPHTEPLEFEFRWGLRADKEVSKLKLLTLVAQLHEQDPQTWATQHKEATQAEGTSR
ncbi:necdin-like 2 [Lepisosteus oculatus]|uniref:Necdin-like 2 n=1 Tax=Lepisosteus oculatus TaxID=7918 RepID=W5NEH9_LEPOC|nr:PREDICTED: melanoma-associated antigen G1-like [Lepisosteus oculatus]